MDTNTGNSGKKDNTIKDTLKDKFKKFNDALKDHKKANNDKKDKIVQEEKDKQDARTKNQGILNNKNDEDKQTFIKDVLDADKNNSKLTYGDIMDALYLTQTNKQTTPDLKDINETKIKLFLKLCEITDNKNFDLSAIKNYYLFDKPKKGKVDEIDGHIAKFMLDPTPEARYTTLKNITEAYVQTIDNTNGTSLANGDLIGEVYKYNNNALGNNALVKKALGKKPLGFYGTQQIDKLSKVQKLLDLRRLKSDKENGRVKPFVGKILVITVFAAGILSGIGTGITKAVLKKGAQPTVNPTALTVVFNEAENTLAKIYKEAGVQVDNVALNNVSVTDECTNIRGNFYNNSNKYTGSFKASLKKDADLKEAYDTLKTDIDNGVPTMPEPLKKGATRAEKKEYKAALDKYNIDTPIYNENVTKYGEKLNLFIDNNKADIVKNTVKTSKYVIEKAAANKLTERFNNSKDKSPDIKLQSDKDYVIEVSALGQVGAGFKYNATATTADTTDNNEVNFEMTGSNMADAINNYLNSSLVPKIEVTTNAIDTIIAQAKKAATEAEKDPTFTYNKFEYKELENKPVNPTGPTTGEIKPDVPTVPGNKPKPIPGTNPGGGGNIWLSK